MEKSSSRILFSRFYFLDSRTGYSLIELLIVIALIAILGTVGILSLGSRRGHTELDGTAKQIVSILREAQGRAIAQDSGVAWGVHFDNATTPAFYALYATSYAPTATRGYWRLPPSVRYAASSIPQGSTLDISFAQLSGIPSNVAIITVQLINGSESMNISISANGLIGI